MKMKLLLTVIVTLFCVVYTNPVPEETIDLINIPLNGDKELDVISFSGSDGKISERNKRTIGILRELFPQLSQVRAVEEENLLEPSSAGSDADAILETIRVAREINNLNNNQNNQINKDQETQETEKTKIQLSVPTENGSSVDELSLDSIEDEENRGKRFLSLNGASGGGSGSGGSGNFLFDIIRLVSGSSGTEQTDEKNNGADSESDTDVGKGDGYTEGIPGPVTRLFVLANRGLSNLIQDLILRIAQTSERVVNFKARLINALI